MNALWEEINPLLESRLLFLDMLGASHAQESLSLNFTGSGRLTSPVCPLNQTLTGPSVQTPITCTMAVGSHREQVDQDEDLTSLPKIF